MTDCAALMLDEGIIFVSDSRTHAGVGNVASVRKPTVFKRAGHRVLSTCCSTGKPGPKTICSCRIDWRTPESAVISTRIGTRRATA